MECERRSHEFSVTHAIHYDAPNDDSEAKAGESCAVDQPNFQTRKVKYLDPIIEDPAANGKADSCREDRHETGKQEPLCVGDNRFVADLNIAHRFLGVCLVWDYRVKVGSLTSAPPLSAD